MFGFLLKKIAYKGLMMRKASKIQNSAQLLFGFVHLWQFTFISDFREHQLIHDAHDAALVHKNT